MLDLQALIATRDEPEKNIEGGESPNCRTTAHMAGGWCFIARIDIQNKHIQCTTLEYWSILVDNRFSPQEEMRKESQPVAQVQEKVGAWPSFSLSWQHHLLLGARALRRGSTTSGFSRVRKKPKQVSLRDVILQEEQGKTWL